MADYKTWQLLRDGLRRVHFWRTRKATGGSTSTIVNANDSAIEDDSAYTGGTAIILRSTDGNAPQGEIARISAYSGSSQTFTLADTLTAGVDAGDGYAVATNRIELEEYIELINDALQAFDIPLLDTSLTSAASQTEYSLPVAIKQNEPARIHYQTNTDDADDNGWAEILDWQVIATAIGSAGTLILPQLPSGRTIRIQYRGKHPRVEAFDDPISEAIDPILARAAFVERIYNRLDEETQHQADPFREGYNKAKAELEEAIQAYPIRRLSRRARLMAL